MMVIEARVVEPSLRRQSRRVRRSPGAGDVLTKRLRAGVERGETASAALPSNFSIEVTGVTPRAERPSAVWAMLPPPNTPYNFPTCSLHLLHAHREPPRRLAQRTERRDGPAAFGARGEQRCAFVRRCLGVVAHSLTASAGMIQRDPRLTP